ncbi:diacylglycerol/lipid kinase family protein [Peribacillus cavernae]|nr:diacylglycerol kinase family protein [Peribacillus cavernae]MDQ0220307.1 YegS/Rv2252/BmrU family lipid kinase [Peribacillus cavernae]
MRMLQKKETGFDAALLKRAGIAKDLYFIINPAAQNNRSLKIWKKVETRLLAENIAYQAFHTQDKGHAKQITIDILSKTDRETTIIAVGGDGTLHEVINGAAGYPHGIIACIPAGSGNDYVRGIQQTNSQKDALSLILSQSEKRISKVDIGYLETQETKGFFINSFGIGIDAEITYDVNHSASKKWFNFFKIGKLVYIYSFLKKLFTYRRTDMTVTIDGRKHIFRKVWFIVVSNQSYFGGGIKISPRSEYEDGRFNLIAVHDIPHIKLLFVFLTVLWGGHLRLKNVSSFLGREMEITSDKPVRIQADGEIVGNSKVYAAIAPYKMRILSKEP